MSLRGSKIIECSSYLLLSKLNNTREEKSGRCPIWARATGEQVAPDSGVQRKAEMK